MAKGKGLYEKYKVERIDGKDDDRILGYDDRGAGQPLVIPADYFVLKLNSGNQFELDALEAYADSCSDKLPLLARDLYKKVLRYRKTIRS